MAGRENTVQGDGSVAQTARMAEAEWMEEALPETTWGEGQESVELAALRRVELEQVKEALQGFRPFRGWRFTELCRAAPTGKWRNC